jgi:glycosyltransferase involved in cell wall biosynthesis
VTPGQPLRGIRVVAALPGLELFGQERENIEVFNALREAGAIVWVGVNAAEGGGAAGEEVRALGFTSFALPFSNQWSWKWLRKYPLSVYEKFKAVAVCSRRFHRALRDLHATHAYLPSSLAYSYVSLALAASRVPLVYRAGDSPPFDSPFNLRVWRLAARRSAKIVAISEFIRRTILVAGAAPERVSVIYNVAPRAATADTGAGHPGSLDDGRPRQLVYVGQMAEFKGLRVLVQAFPLLAERFPDLTLKIVGGSRYQESFRRELERMIADGGLQSRIDLVGHVDDPGLFYRAADVHVAPSLCDEALGCVVLEAKREGIPSVVFRSGGLPETLTDGVDGVICPEKTPVSLASGIAWLLEDRERRAAAGRAARENYLRRFGPERFAQQWAALFTDGSARESGGRVFPEGPAA